MSRRVSERWAEALGRDAIDTLAEMLRAINGLQDVAPRKASPGEREHSARLTVAPRSAWPVR